MESRQLNVMGVAELPFPHYHVKAIARMKSVKRKTGNRLLHPTQAADEIQSPRSPRVLLIVFPLGQVCCSDLDQAFLNAVHDIEV